MRNKFEQKLNKAVEEPDVVLPVEKEESGKDNILNFVVPKEIVDLPSRGRFYPEDHPLFCKEYVEIKQMTAKEEDILTNKSFIKKGIVIDRLIQSLLIDKSIDVSTLLVGDKNAIIIAARIAAYGADYDVQINCQECNYKNTVSIDLLKVFTRDVDKILQECKSKEHLQHERLESGNIIIKLPKTGWKVECKLLNGKDERIILGFMESKKEDDPEAEMTISDQLNFIIYSINDVNDVELIDAAVEIMPASDAKLLRNLYQKLIPNVAIQKKFTCRSCQAEQELEVPFTQEFFWPK